jgi:hypothetical protein
LPRGSFSAAVGDALRTSWRRLRLEEQNLHGFRVSRKKAFYIQKLQGIPMKTMILKFKSH